ncbi:MAG: hypothetical protein WBQ23_14890 [Bacteroidota bacterium]
MPSVLLSDTGRKWDSTALAIVPALPILPALLFVVLLLFAAGCSKDETVVQTPICPSTGIDARLVGDWMQCDSAGNFGTNGGQYGLHIEADGTFTQLAVDWRDGSVAINSETCGTDLYYCVGSNTIGRSVTPVDYDTVTFSIDGDQLIFSRPGPPVSSQQFRRVTLGQIIEQPVACSLLYTFDSTEYGAVVVWPYPPVRVGVTSGNDPMFVLEGSGLKAFWVRISDFHGVGTYFLGEDVFQSHAFTMYGCPVINQQFGTRDDDRSTISITEFDVGTGRCSGSFDFTLWNYADVSHHVIGTFNAPIVE